MPGGTLVRTLGLIVAAAFLGTAAGAPPPDREIRVNAQRIEARIQGLSAFGRNPEGGVSRVSFSQADLDGRAYVMGLMREAGLEVSIDFAGNILGRRPGSEPGVPPILFGSHIDSVPKGGNYDGDVGVIGAIECAQVLDERGVETRHPLEVIVFSDEEGGLVGSRALIGELSDAALEVESHSGLTIRDGIRAIGGDPDRLDEVVRQTGDVAAFLELHIEQGAFLYDDQIDIGIVEGIVGIDWWDVVVEGVANHAGTTPMDKRADALVAAAKYVLAVNRIATSEPGRQVATVGKIAAEPGAHNVIPGRVRTSLEIRDLDAAKIERIYGKIRTAVLAIEAETGTRFTFSPLDVSAIPAPTDERMRALIARAARELNLSYRFMPSGAGHDAQDMAKIAPTGMIFVPSVDGISHAPNEATTAADMANGADVLLRTILAIDRGALEHSQ